MNLAKLLDSKESRGYLVAIKKAQNIKMKLMTICISIEDYKIVKYLILRKIFPNLPELIRYATYHFTFLEKAIIVDDRNWNHNKNDFPKKSNFGFHLPDGLKSEIVKRYELDIETFSFSLCIRQFLHQYLEKFMLSLKKGDIIIE